MQPNTNTFPRRWMIGNSLALLVGFLLYTPIGHGITGPHPHGLNRWQLLSHSVAFAVVAAITSVVQRRMLQEYVRVPWIRIPFAVVGFMAAMWVGYYQPWLRGPDWDIIFGSFVLGSAVFWGTVPTRGHHVAFTVALLSFPVACFIGQSVIVGIALMLGVVPDVQANVLQHSIYWIGVGVSIGTLGGWISGLALRRMLQASESSASMASVRTAG